MKPLMCLIIAVASFKLAVFAAPFPPLGWLVSLVLFPVSALYTALGFAFLRRM